MDKNNRIKIVLLSMFLLILLVLPLIVEFSTGTMNLLVMLFIYVVLAQCWNLMGGYTGLFNLGMAAFFGCGVLTCHLLWRGGLPFFLAMLAAGFISMALACIIGIPTLKLKGFYFAIGTLAISEALRITIGNLFPTRIIMPADYFTNFSLLSRYYLALALTLFTLAIIFGITKAKLGLAILAIRDDEEAANVTGINVFKCKVIVFLISTFLAGLTGGVYTYFRLSVTPVDQFLPNWTFEPLLAASIGGAGTIIGPILGSIIMVLIQNWFALTLGQGHYIVLGILFILVVIIYPGGLAELVQRKRDVKGGLQ